MLVERAGLLIEFRRMRRCLGCPSIAQFSLGHTHAWSRCPRVPASPRVNRISSAFSSFSVATVCRNSSTRLALCRHEQRAVPTGQRPLQPRPVGMPGNLGKRTIPGRHYSVLLALALALPDHHRPALKGHVEQLQPQQLQGTHARAVQRLQDPTVRTEASLYGCISMTDRDEQLLNATRTPRN